MQNFFLLPLIPLGFTPFSPFPFVIPAALYGSLALASQHIRRPLSSVSSCLSFRLSLCPPAPGIASLSPGALPLPLQVLPQVALLSCGCPQHTGADPLAYRSDMEALEASANCQDPRGHLSVSRSTSGHYALRPTGIQCHPSVAFLCFVTLHTSSSLCPGWTPK